MPRSIAVLLSLVPLTLITAAHAGPDVIFVPGEFPDRCASRLPDNTPLCPEGTSSPGPNWCDLPLPTLREAAKSFGITCSGDSSPTVTAPSEGIELVLLVDDRNLTIPLENLLDPVVRPGSRFVARTRGVFRNMSGSVVRDMLIVGENRRGIEIGVPEVIDGATLAPGSDSVSDGETRAPVPPRQQPDEEIDPGNRTAPDVTARILACTNEVLRSYSQFNYNYIQQFVGVQSALCPAAHVPDDPTTQHLRTSFGLNYAVKAIGLRDGLYQYLSGHSGFEPDYCELDRRSHPSDPKRPTAGGGLASEGMRRSSAIWFGDSDRLNSSCPQHPQDCPVPRPVLPVDEGCRSLLIEHMSTEIELTLRVGQLSSSGEIVRDRVPPVVITKRVREALGTALDVGLCSTVNLIRRNFSGDLLTYNEIYEDISGDQKMCNRGELTQEFLQPYQPPTLWRPTLIIPARTRP